MARSSLLTRSREFLRRVREDQNLRRYGDESPFSWEWQSRADRYAQWTAFYDNTIYRPQNDGGYKETILSDVFNVNSTETFDIFSLYNPVKPIVDAYQNVLRGKYGREIKVAPEYDGVEVNPKLRDAKDNPLAKIWRWSNLDSAKQLYQKRSAGLGACGIRVVGTDAQDGKPAKVRITFDNPTDIKDYQEDDSGNVTEIMLEYERLGGKLGEGRFPVEVREIISKDRFFVEHNGETVQDTPNPFGFCPYVVNHHETPEGEYGLPAFYGSEDIIHRINWLKSNEGNSVFDHSYPTWFATASGKKPEVFEVGGKRVAYVQTEPQGVVPSLNPLVPNVPFASITEYIGTLEQHLEQRQPELVLSNLRLIGGISGETVNKVLVLAEQAILRARDNYESKLIRALQMGLSMLVRYGVLDLGTGSGSVQASDAAYQSGAENFEFMDRPALPQTAADKVTQATADTARRRVDLTDAKTAQGLVHPDEALKIAGYTDAQLDEVRPPPEPKVKPIDPRVAAAARRVTR